MNQLLQITGCTDQGQVRESNEDAFFVDVNSGLMVVSDGMGGQQAGEIASRIVVEALPAQLAAGRAEGELDEPAAAASFLVQALDILGEMVFEKSRQVPQLAGMGATVVVGQLVGSELVLAHMGDSRAYLLRRNFFEQLTKDHTMADLLLEAGAISQRDHRHHPSQHMLRRFVGMENCPPADLCVLELRPGDRILLCSDGLTGMVDDRTIGQILLDERHRPEACQRLIDLANQAGGKDNITVVLADVPDEEERPERAGKVVVRRGVGRSLRRPQITGTPATSEDLIPEEQSNG